MDPWTTVGVAALSQPRRFTSGGKTISDGPEPYQAGVYWTNFQRTERAHVFHIKYMS